MPVEGLARPQTSRTRGLGFITQRVDHPASGLLPFAIVHRSGQQRRWPNSGTCAVLVPPGPGILPASPSVQSCLAVVITVPVAGCTMRSCPMDGPAIELRGVRRSYDAEEVLHGIDLTIERGGGLRLPGAQRRREDDRHRPVVRPRPHVSQPTRLHRHRLRLPLREGHPDHRRRRHACGRRRHDHRLVAAQSCHLVSGRPGVPNHRVPAPQSRGTSAPSGRQRARSPSATHVPSPPKRKSLEGRVRRVLPSLRP